MDRGMYGWHGIFMMERGFAQVVDLGWLDVCKGGIFMMDRGMYGWYIYASLMCQWCFAPLIHQWCFAPLMHQ